jgi:medium-chain acyl-[acyl-carrier-protein] hydrolase
MDVFPANSWFQHWQAKPQARVRLFCFPYAGGGASIFRTWAEHLPPEIAVCPVQLPGRESRLLEEAHPEISSLVDELAQALLPYLDLPYAFFGHSMGALIGFELTRYLCRKNYSPGPLHLFVSAHRAPQILDPDQPTHNLPEPAFIEELRRLKGTPEEIMADTELLHLVLPLLRADFALCETYHYVPERPLSCPITALGGLQDEEVPRNMLAAWKVQTRKAFKLRFFAGDHFFLHKERAALLHVLALDLLNDLQAAD